MHSLSLAFLFPVIYASQIVQRANSTRYGTVPTEATRSLVFVSSASGQGIVIQPHTIQATDCSGSWDNWLILSQAAAATGVLSTFPTTWTYYNMTAKVTTLCDGHPRIVGGSDGLTTTATGTSTSMTIQYVWPTTTFSKPTPRCIPLPAERTSISQYWGVFVPNTTRATPVNDPTTSSLPPSVFTAKSGACGPCSIFGGQVQLLYFEPTTPVTLCPATAIGSPTLCPLTSTLHPYTETNPFEFSPCAYATANLTSTANSGPFIVSEGNTFYQNRAYVSIHTAFAVNSCGFVGSRFSETILTIASSDVYTIDGYHHEFQDVGYIVDYANFATVPADVYYQGCNLTNSGQSATYCSYTGSRYRYNTDFINGINTIDFGNVFQPANTSNQWIWEGAYAPTLLVPLQMRLLDPAWSTCSLNLNGLYDPPRLLTNSLIFPTPTTPGVKPTTSAAPASSLQGGPRETASNPTHPASNPTAHLSKASQTSGLHQVGGSPPTVPGTSDPSQDGPKQPSKTNDTPNSAGSHTGLPPVASRSSSAANDPASSPSPTTHNILAAVATFTISHRLHTISVLPSTVGLYAIDNQYTVTTGDPAVIIDGMPITISSLDSLAIGDRTMDLPQDSQDDGGCTTTFDEGSAVHSIIHLPGTKALYLLDDSYTVAEGSPTTVVDSMHLYIGAYARVIAGQQTMTLAASLASSSGGTVGKETSRGPAASLVGSASLTPSASASSTSGGSRKAQLCRITILMSLSMTFVALLR